MDERCCIVITSGLGLHQQPEDDVDVRRYIDALERFGAEPLVVPKGREAVRTLHRPGVRGVLFSGGGDIDAQQYGGREELCKRVDSERDAGEIQLFQEAYFRNVPILGICRGMQLANVALGGSLIEDVPGHHSGSAGAERFDYMHGVRIAAGSQLALIVKSAAHNKSILQVNSVHHQVIDKLAPQLRASAFSQDGVIEAIESEGEHPGFFVGVQWHPEALSASDEASAAIFRAFIGACRGRSSGQSPRSANFPERLRKAIPYL